jgi:hypothetical protein
MDYLKVLPIITSVILFAVVPGSSLVPRDDSIFHLTATHRMYNKVQLQFTTVAHS